VISDAILACGSVGEIVYSKNWFRFSERCSKKKPRHGRGFFFVATLFATDQEAAS
jgi:hypothetical protein